MPQLLLLCLSTIINNKPEEYPSVIDSTSSKFCWDIYYKLHLFQLHFSYSYFISATVTFQWLSLFQLHLQLTDLEYLSYCSFQLQLQLT